MPGIARSASFLVVNAAFGEPFLLRHEREPPRLRGFFAPDFGSGIDTGVHPFGRRSPRFPSTESMNRSFRDERPRVPKNIFTFLAALALCAVPLASAAQDPFAGSWRAAYPINGMSCQFDLVMTTTGTYNEIDRCGTYVTGQSGTYRVFPNHIVGRSVTDWMPKSHYVVGAAVGTGHYEPSAKPPGGMYRYTFTTANTMVWRDVNAGGTVTFHRVR